MADLISVPREIRAISPSFATQLESRLNEPVSSAIFAWDRGCVTVPTSTTIASAEKIVFESPFEGNGTLLVTVYDAGGGVHVALNGVDLGPLTGPASVEKIYELPINNLVTGVEPLNVFQIWSTTSDSAELRKLEVYRDFTADQTASEFNENRTYIKFDGSVNGSRLEVADDDAWDFEAAEAGTWEAWAYVDVVGTAQTFISKNLGSTTAWGFWTTSSSLQIWLNNGSATTTLDHQTPLSTGWHHVAFSRDTSGVMWIYLDGIKSTSSIIQNLTMANSGALQFGARQDTVDELTGRMRDIRRWSDVRTQSEIIVNRFADLVGTETGLIGFWPCREGAKGTANNLGSTSDGNAVLTTTGPAWGGPVGAGTATDNSDALTGQLILAGATIEQSSGGAARILTEGMAGGVAFDGDTFTFDPARDSVPLIIWGAGGKTESSALTPPTWKDFQAQSLTTSGFTAYLKLSEIASSLTARTETGPTTGGTYDYEMNKDETADEAFDDNYTYQIDVSVNAAVGGGEPGPSTVEVAYLANNGAGWVEKATKIFSNTNTGSAKTYLNNRQVINHDGMGLNDDWAVDVKSTSGNGGSITAFDNVTYESGSGTPTVESATPTGVSGIAFEVKSGEEGSIT